MFYIRVNESTKIIYNDQQAYFHSLSNQFLSWTLHVCNYVSTDAAPRVRRTCRNLVKAEIYDVIRKKFRWFPWYPYPYTYTLEISTSLLSRAQNIISCPRHINSCARHNFYINTLGISYSCHCFDAYSWCYSKNNISSLCLYSKDSYIYNKNHMAKNDIWKWQEWFLLIILEIENMLGN